MKALVKATGEIVWVHTTDDADFIDGNGRYYWEHELFFGSLDDPDYWTRLEHKAAIAAMQGMLSNPAFPEHSQEGYYKKNIVNNAYEYAHTLVEKLKSSDL